MQIYENQHDYSLLSAVQNAAAPLARQRERYGLIALSV